MGDQLKPCLQPQAHPARCGCEQRAALAGQAAPAAVPDECPHMIVFDDTDREPLMFVGSGARAAAIKAWAAVSINWNAHLFVRIGRNCRDDRYPCALLAEAPAAPVPAAQEPVDSRECRVISFVPGMGEVTFRVDGAVPAFMDVGETICVSPVPAARHSDDAAVDRFAVEMKAKLAASRAKGRGGWDDSTKCRQEYLADLLLHHLCKTNLGNFVDIANLAMMLHLREADPHILSDRIKRDGVVFAPPAAEQRGIAMPPRRSWDASAGTAENMKAAAWNDALDAVARLNSAQAAAEQPDTVKVPRELVHRVLWAAKVAPSCQRYVVEKCQCVDCTTGELRALLGKEGEV